ncbi:MAG: menaquinone biosynthesis protein [Chthoniobacterales bacterium]
MQAPASLRLGCVKYLNALPLIHGWPGPVHFDHPSKLCRQLAAGELDVALVSSFEYLRHPIYSVVDQVAIASNGAVYSVILAHTGSLAELREVVLDPASETSANLLRCLLGGRGIATEFVTHGELSPTRGRLLIGDQAIRFRQQAGERYRFLDLGAAWQEQTSHPFVYALWLMRPDFAEKQEVADALRLLAKDNLQKLEQVIATQPETERAFCEFYFRQCLRFSFGDSEKEGFQKFAETCVTQKLLAKLPPAPALV